MLEQPKTVLICGSGNAAHVFAASIASTGVNARVFESLGQEQVDKFDQGLKSNGGKVSATFLDGTVREGTPELTTCEPDKAAAGLTSEDLVLMPIPSFAIPPVLRKIAPFLPKGILIGAMPGQGGLDWEVHQVLKELDRSDIVLLGTNTLPFACRIEEFGAKVQCPGLKREIAVTTSPPSLAKEVARKLTELFRPITLKLEENAEPFYTEYKAIPNFLCLTLQPANQIVHPTILRSLCERQDVYDEAPEFYWSLDEPTEKIMLKLEAEIFDVANALDKKNSSLTVRDNIVSIHELLLKSYKDSIPEDQRGSTLTCFRSNEVYKGMGAPMTDSPDGKGLIPNVNSRYLTEDVPDSLVLLKGVAELCEVSIPQVDDLIIWSQKQMGKEYLVQEGDKWTFTGKDIATSRAPQRYGLDTIEKLINLYA